MEDESEFLASMYADAKQAQKNNPVMKIPDRDFQDESVDEDLNVEDVSDHSDHEMVQESYEPLPQQ